MCVAESRALALKSAPLIRQREQNKREMHFTYTSHTPTFKLLLLGLLLTTPCPKHPSHLSFSFASTTGGTCFSNLPLCMMHGYGKLCPLSGTRINGISVLCGSVGVFTCTCTQQGVVQFAFCVCVFSQVPNPGVGQPRLLSQIHEQGQIGIASLVLLCRRRRMGNKQFGFERTTRRRQRRGMQYQRGRVELLLLPFPSNCQP